MPPSGSADPVCCAEQALLMPKRDLTADWRSSKTGNGKFLVAGHPASVVALWLVQGGAAGAPPVSGPLDIFSPLPRLLPRRLFSPTSPRRSVANHLKRMVGATGFEPATSRP